MLAHPVYHAANLLRRTSLVGIHGPEVKLLKAKVSRQIAERAFAGHKPAVFSRNSLDLDFERRKRLAEFDLSQEEITRLHGPVGLKIGSKTPPEIAVAILAEMTAIRNGVDVTTFVEPLKATTQGCVIG